MLFRGAQGQAAAEAGGDHRIIGTRGMLLVEKLFRWLATGPAPDCDLILADALKRAEPAWSERIVNTLRHRNTEASWAALVGAYEKLPDDVRDWLRDEPERLETAVAQVLRIRDADTRLNALRLLAETPSPPLAFAVAGVLRDPNRLVRQKAGEVLRITSDAALNIVKAPGVGEEVRRTTRRQIIEALREALRTFPLHSRSEALQACLWFARDLGDELWRRLTAPSSRAGMIAAEHILVWDDPRMAGFLVTALRYPAWRSTAQRVLRAWRSPEQIAALFAQADLLRDDGVRRAVATIKQPAWFSEVGGNLDRIPVELRPHAPAWLGACGVDEHEKLALLALWVEADDDTLRNAALDAVSRLSLPEAHAIVEQAATAAPGEPPEPTPESAPERTKQPESAATSPADEEFKALWSAGRNLHPAQRTELIARIRSHLPQCRELLRRRLHGADPRDRVMALQVVSSRAWALRFRADLELLTRDPVEAIRRLAQSMIQSISGAPPQPDSQGESENATPPDADDPRAKLSRTLRELMREGPDQPDGRLVDQVRSLLRKTYADLPGAGDAADTSEGDSK
ncbi:MAG: hypothetical protein D6744_14935 [Planctomycetota bacterium]|nr:MAG: hypothetical protein D6744_14935 [Planctomycetota bacterium]